ncbi:MAG: hypothetical protein LBQ66_10475 [Planctomycetaceae bacterium]|jgi:hypothetical protein|nr:hypothetical protein [Planctomycetaceae bacterium]
MRYSSDYHKQLTLKKTMQKNVKKTVPENVKWLEVDLPYYLIEGTNFSEYVPSNLRFKSRLVFKVDVKTGTIQNWKSDGKCDFCFRVAKKGVYKLYDENYNLLYVIHGRSPYRLIPEGGGFGYYITLDVREDGLIVNWFHEPSIIDFLEAPDEERPDEGEDDDDDMMMFR